MVVFSFGSGSRHNHRTTMTAAIHAALSFLLNIPHTTSCSPLTNLQLRYFFLECEQFNHLLDCEVTISSILPRKRRKLGNQVDVLSVTPDSQWQPGSGRLPADDLVQIVRIAHLQTGGPHNMISSLQPSSLSNTAADNPIDAGRAITLHQMHAKPGARRRRCFLRSWQSEYGIGIGSADVLACGVDRYRDERCQGGYPEILELMGDPIAVLHVPAS